MGTALPPAASAGFPAAPKLSASFSEPPRSCTLACTARLSAEASGSAPTSGLHCCLFRKIHVPPNMPSSSPQGSLSLATEGSRWATVVSCAVQSLPKGKFGGAGACRPEGQSEEQPRENIGGNANFLAKFFCGTRCPFLALTSRNVLGEPLFECTSLKHGVLLNVSLMRALQQLFHDAYSTQA